MAVAMNVGPYWSISNQPVPEVMSKTWWPYSCMITSFSSARSMAGTWPIRMREGLPDMNTALG
jgi:hypothetical protein